jgi:cellulose synthase/poly-beta-1,6-N-acetylglucosamine synthase-like glycosyltransferase
MTCLFLLAAVCLVYTYAGYPLVLFLVAQCRQRPTGYADDLLFASLSAPPPVSVIVAAHNEAESIVARVRNLLAQHYPHDRLEVIVGSDGSTDATAATIAALADPRVRLLDLRRQGRALVHNACVAIAAGDIVVFTDAGTHFDAHCLRRLVRPFIDPYVGCTGGRLVYTNSGEPGIAQGAGWYWRYELSLRRLETAIGSTVAVTGACMAMRKSLFRPLSAVDDIDDAAPVDTLLQHARVLFVSDALAYDRLPASTHNELAARQRIVTKNLTAVVRRPRILSPMRHFGAAWMLLSHRVLRYLTPVFLVLLLASNVALRAHPPFQITLAAQLLFYGCAALGFAADRRRWRVPVLSVCFALCLANLGFLLGVLNIVRGRGVAHYEPIR